MTTSSLPRAVIAQLTPSEATFQWRVILRARSLGWLVFHAYSSRRSAPGFPDLCMVRDGRLILAELKVGREPVRPHQREWLDQLGTVQGVETYLWRWEWPDGPDLEERIAEVLAR